MLQRKTREKEQHADVTLNLNDPVQRTRKYEHGDDVGTYYTLTRRYDLRLSAFEDFNAV